MTEEIAALAAALGKTAESEELRTLCKAAEGELTGLLREGVSPEDCEGMFPLAAAWMALGAMEVAGDDVESFSAGTVSVRKKDGALRRKALRLQALQVMKPYIRDEGFVFRGVKG